MPRETLYIADEVFFVGTAAEVTPIRSVDRIEIGAGRARPDHRGDPARVLRHHQRRGARHARLADLRLPETPGRALETRRAKTTASAESPTCLSTMHVNDLLKIAVENGASDLHLKVGSFPMMRVRGALMPASEEKRLDHEDMVAMAPPSCRRAQRQKFKDAQEVDLAYSVPALGRFRCNVFQQRGTIGLVLRVIPMQIRTIDELGLPGGADEDRRRGARPGARHRHDRQRQEHDARRDDRPHQPHALRARDDDRGPDRVPAPRQPVDHQPARGGGRHARRSPTRCAARCARIPTSSWSARCATSRRSRPALLAAETGHLVFSTLHTLDATETINRIIAVFPPHQQKQVRLQLAAC